MRQSSVLPGDGKQKQEESAGLILDMDGVLFESESLHALSWTDVVAPLGLTLAPDWFAPWIGIPDTEAAANLHALLPQWPAAELLARKREGYLKRTRTELSLFPGVGEEIAALARAGVPLAVATSSSKEHAEPILRRLGIDKHLDALVCAEDVARKKPAPDPYLLAARRLGRQARRCLVIEDTPVGIASGRAAGCRVLAVATSLPLNRLADAEFVFESTIDAIRFAKASLL